MSKNSPEAMAQVFKIKDSEPTMTARAIAQMVGIHHSTVARWLQKREKEKPEQQSTDEELAQLRESGRKVIEASPAFMMARQVNHFKTHQFELLQRHSRDLEVLRARQMKAIIDNDSMMIRAIAASVVAILKIQESEKKTYQIQPGTEGEIMRKGMNGC